MLIYLFVPVWDRSRCPQTTSCGRDSWFRGCRRQECLRQVQRRLDRWSKVARHCSSACGSRRQALRSICRAKCQRASGAATRCRMRLRRKYSTITLFFGTWFRFLDLYFLLKESFLLEATGWAQRCVNNFIICSIDGDSPSTQSLN